MSPPPSEQKRTPPTSGLSRRGPASTASPAAGSLVPWGQRATVLGGLSEDPGALWRLEQHSAPLSPQVPSPRPQDGPPAERTKTLALACEGSISGPREARQTRGPSHHGNAEILLFWNPELVAANPEERQTARLPSSSLRALQKRGRRTLQGAGQLRAIRQRSASLRPAASCRNF